MRIAINGFGRIGRLIYRLFALKENCDIEVVAINDLAPIDRLAYLLKYDSVHGRSNFDIKIDQNILYCQKHTTHVLNESNPLNLPWKQLDLDYVIESSGRFTTYEGANCHLKAGAQRVLITAPGKGDMPTLVFGVNHEKYNPVTDLIISNASCTTHCLAILIKILLEEFGIEEGLMTTIHSMTASQMPVDTASTQDWREGRAASLNIIPSSTGAAYAVSLCLPEIRGKLTGMAFRVPTIDVSAVDLTIRLKKNTHYDEICAAMKKASEGPYKGLLNYCDDFVVSSDFIGSPYSCIFDQKSGMSLNERFFKLIAWYDNEWAYANRILDIVMYMAKKENSQQIKHYKTKEVNPSEFYSRTHY